MKKDKNAALIWIPFGIVLLVSMGCFLFDLVLACVNYTPARGVFSSRFVGFSNFDRLFADAGFSALLSSSLTYAILNILCALLLGAPLALVLGFIPNRHVKTAFAGAALVIALLPDLFWVQGVQKLLGTLNPDAFLAAYMLCRLAPLTALSVFAGLTLHLAEGKNGVIGALTAGLLPLFSLFTPDIRTVSLLQTAAGGSASDHLSTAAVRIGLFSGQYSLGEAMTLTGVFFNLIVGAGFVFALGALLSRKMGMTKSHGGTWLGEGMTSLAGAAAAGLAVVLAWAVSKTFPADALTGRAALNTLGAGLLAAALAFGVCLLLFACCRDCRRGFGVMFIIFLLTQLGAPHVSRYIAAKDLGMVNTILPVGVGVLTHPLFLTVLAVLMACRPSGKRQLLFTSAGAACIAAAVAAGDCCTSALYVTDTRAATLAAFARSSFATGASAESIFLLMTFIAAALFAAAGAVMTFAGLGGTEIKKGNAF